jgi:hypothetical protein
MRALILAGLLAATAVVARADDDTLREANRADVRCVIGMSVMSRNEQYKSWGTTGLFFFAGRVEGRDPAIDLERAIKREVGQMRPAEYQEEIQRCSAQLGEKSRAFEAMKPKDPRGVGR